MDVYGIDFTSAPTKRKPITFSCGELVRETLLIGQVNAFYSFDEFEAHLHTLGACVAGFDFPFGQPNVIIDALGWAKPWEGYVYQVGELTRKGFEERLELYKFGQKPGRKHHFRQADLVAKSCSPMMMFGVPVGKMFFEGAPRLLSSGACIQPCRPNNDPRIFVEAYPALVARRWSDGQSYKSDAKRKQTKNREDVRRAIVKGLCAEARKHFGFEIVLPGDLAGQCIQDGSGDTLDACLCAVQAGWAWTQRDKNYGIPENCDPNEGWIVDPSLID
jgi:hypothetical protein